MQSSQDERSIYIVDDEAALANMAQQILSLGGYEASVFDDPAKALEHIKQSKTKSVLLITDCMMGEMNGLELIEEVRKHVKELRTILLSGTITGEFVEKCQTQPDRFLPKPYPADSLLAIVNELSRNTAARSTDQR